MATLAELAQIDVADDEAPDSISFANLLRDPDDRPERQTLVMQSVVSFVIRKENWKLCLCPGSGVPSTSVHAIGNDPMPEVAWRDALARNEGGLTNRALLRPPFVQLFDLDADPHEDHNLADRQPARVREMVALLQGVIARGRSTPGRALSNDRRISVVDRNDRRLPDFVRSAK